MCNKWIIVIKKNFIFCHKMLNFFLIHYGNNGNIYHLKWHFIIEVIHVKIHIIVNFDMLAKEFIYVA